MTSNAVKLPIDYNALGELCKKNGLDENQIGIYGHQICLKIDTDTDSLTCGYRTVGNQIIKDIKNSESHQIKEFFNWRIGSPKVAPSRTLEGRALVQINLNGHCLGSMFYQNHHFALKEACKAGLVDLVIENYKRKQEGNPLIPLIFFMGSNKMSIDIEPKGVCSRDKLHITDSELRRCYKLISKEELLKSNDGHAPLTPELAEGIAEVAEQTFYCMSIDLNDDKFTFTEQTPVWKKEGWEEEWQKRMQSKELKSMRPAKPAPWRVEMAKNLMLSSTSPH